MNTTTAASTTAGILGRRSDGVVLALSDGTRTLLTNGTLAELRHIDHAFAITVDDQGGHIALRHGPRLDLTHAVLARLVAAHTHWANGERVSA